MNFKNHEKVMVVVAHRDDESLGCGGVIARHRKNGDAVFCVSMTDGVTGRGKVKVSDTHRRLRASEKAGKILGFEWLDSEIFPDNRMDTVPLSDVAKFIESHKTTIQPTLVYTHSSADLNIDHRIVSHATLIAFRPQPGEIWSEIRAFEVPSSTDYGHHSVTGAFCPNLYIDIKDTVDRKVAALNEYGLEMRPYPHSRSSAGLTNLARYRGSQSGLEYAEAFEVIRRIER